MCMACRKAAMVPAIVLGIVFGCVAVLPLYLGSKKARFITAESRFSYTSLLLLILLISLILLAVPVVVCAVVAREVLPPFALALAITFIVGVLGFGAFWAKRIR